MIASVWGSSGECSTGAMPSVAWLESVVGFAGDAQGYELLAPDGSVVATLSIDGAPEPIESAADSYTQPPEMTEEARVRLSASAPRLPDGFEAPTVAELKGRWVPREKTGNTDPHLVFEEDGRWTGSDGCNGAQGRWALGSGGAFLSTAGPSTLIGCDGANVSGMVTATAVIGMNADGELHLFDLTGEPIGTLTR